MRSPSSVILILAAAIAALALLTSPVVAVRIPVDNERGEGNDLSAAVFAEEERLADLELDAGEEDLLIEQAPSWGQQYALASGRSNETLIRVYRYPTTTTANSFVYRLPDVGGVQSFPGEEFVFEVPAEFQVTDALDQIVLIHRKAQEDNLLGGVATVNEPAPPTPAGIAAQVAANASAAAVAAGNAPPPELRTYAWDVQGTFHSVWCRIAGTEHWQFWSGPHPYRKVGEPRVADGKRSASIYAEVRGPQDPCYDTLDDVPLHLGSGRRVRCDLIRVINESPREHRANARGRLHGIELHYAPFRGLVDAALTQRKVFTPNTVFSAPPKVLRTSFGGGAYLTAELTQIAADNYPNAATLLNATDAAAQNAIVLNATAEMAADAKNASAPASNVTVPVAAPGIPVTRDVLANGTAVVVQAPGMQPAITPNVSSVVPPATPPVTPPAATDASANASANATASASNGTVAIQAVQSAAPTPRLTADAASSLLGGANATANANATATNATAPATSATNNASANVTVPTPPTPVVLPNATLVPVMVTTYSDAPWVSVVNGSMRVKLTPGGLLARCQLAAGSTGYNATATAASQFSKESEMIGTRGNASVSARLFYNAVPTAVNATAASASVFLVHKFPIGPATVLNIEPPAGGVRLGSAPELVVRMHGTGRVRVMAVECTYYNFMYTS